MKISTVLFESVKDLWDQAAGKPFVIEMAKGILDQQRYRYYMIQDYLYLLKYMDVLEYIRESTDDPGLKDFIGFVLEQIRKETTQVHVPNMKELGITEEDAAGCPESSEITDYISYMLSRVKEEGVLAGLTAQLQCSWVYAYIGQRMMEEFPDEIAASPYKSWFEAYTCDDYTEANRKWIDILDEKAQGADGEEVQKLCSIFRTCAEYENRFWDMLYNFTDNCGCRKEDATMKEKAVIAELAEEYPQLYLNPDTAEKELYRQVVLNGEDPGTKDLSHYQGDEADRLETADTPAGKVQVVTLGNRHDFELVMRSMMAAKDGPLTRIPDSQGASMLTTFNWGRIHAHLDGYPDAERLVEFQKFTSVKENYLDMIVILSRGPYSNVKASVFGYSEDEWLSISDTIRRFHELTHVICRRKYPDKKDPVRDELIADAVGLYAAYGSFDPEMEKKFLGITGETYTGGRLENYTEDAKEITPQVLRMLSDMKQLIDSHPDAEPFDLVPVLMEDAS